MSTMLRAQAVVALLVAGLATAGLVSAAPAADPIVGTWSFGTGQIAVTASGSGFKGTLTSGTVKFGDCSSVSAPASLWTIAGSGGSYTGTYSGKAGEDGGYAPFACTAPKDWSATWTVSGSTLKFCWTGDKGVHCVSASRTGGGGTTTAPKTTTAKTTTSTSTEPSGKPETVTNRWSFVAKGTPYNRSAGTVFKTSTFTGSGTVTTSYDKAMNVKLRATGYARIENYYRPPSAPKGGISFKITGATKFDVRGKVVRLILVGSVTQSDYNTCPSGPVVITLIQGPVSAAQYFVCGATISYANGRPTARETVQVSLSK